MSCNFCCVTAPELVTVTYDIQKIQIDEDIYKVTSQITITPGCFNGPFKYYVLEFMGLRSGYDKIGPYEYYITNWNQTETFDLNPEYTYSLTVAIENEQFRGDEKAFNFTSPAGGKFTSYFSVIISVKLLILSAKF